MLDSKPTRRYCRYCGSSVTPTDAFCSSCGKRLALREGVARDERRAQPAPRVGTRHASFSRFWPASANREITAGVLYATRITLRHTTPLTKRRHTKVRMPHLIIAYSLLRLLVQNANFATLGANPLFQTPHSEPILGIVFTF